MRIASCLILAGAAVVALPNFSSAMAIPMWMNGTGLWQEADDAILISPETITMNAGDTTPTILGQLYKDTITESAGPAASVVAQLGYGAIGSDPTTSAWTWVSTNYDSQVGDNDQYAGEFSIDDAGTYAYTYRFSLDNGGTWTAADLDGAGSAPGLSFDSDKLGKLTVVEHPIPEPASLSLIGLAAILCRRSRRSN